MIKYTVFNLITAHTLQVHLQLISQSSGHDPKIFFTRSSVKMAYAYSADPHQAVPVGVIRSLKEQSSCGFDSCRVSINLSWRFDHEIFSTVILSLPLIQEGQLSVSGKKMCTILVNCLEY